MDPDLKLLVGWSYSSPLNIRQPAERDTLPPPHLGRSPSLFQGPRDQKFSDRTWPPVVFFSICNKSAVPIFFFFVYILEFVESGFAARVWAGILIGIVSSAWVSPDWTTWGRTGRFSLVKSFVSTHISGTGSAWHLLISPHSWNKTAILNSHVNGVCGEDRWPPSRFAMSMAGFTIWSIHCASWSRDLK